MNRPRKFVVEILATSLLNIHLPLAPLLLQPTALAQVDAESAKLIEKIPFFDKTDLKKIKVSIIMDPIDGLNIRAQTSDKVDLGGHKYPAGVVIEGRSDIWRIYMKDSITINGIKICGQFGQHAQTLEIFEIKLCEDSEINGMKIPGGSFVSFIKGDLKKGQKWHEVGCISPGAKMQFKGRAFHKGSILLPRSKDGTVEDPEKVTSCEVQVWEVPTKD